MANTIISMHTNKLTRVTPNMHTLYKLLVMIIIIIPTISMNLT